MRELFRKELLREYWWRYIVLMLPLILFISFWVHIANATLAPYTYEEDKRFRALENGTNLNLVSGDIFIGSSVGKATARAMSGDATISNTGVFSLIPATTDGSLVQRQIRYLYDFSVYGGSDIGTISLDASLPANAVITRSFVYEVTQQSSSPIHATTGISCGSASLQTAADETSVSSGSFIEGDSTGVATAFKKVGGSPCVVTLTIGTGNLTGGKFLGFADYVVIQ